MKLFETKVAIITGVVDAVSGAATLNLDERLRVTGDVVERRGRANGRRPVMDGV